MKQNKKQHKTSKFRLYRKTGTLIYCFLLNVCFFTSSLSCTSYWIWKAESQTNKCRMNDYISANSAYILEPSKPAWSAESLAPYAAFKIETEPKLRFTDQFMWWYTKHLEFRPIYLPPRRHCSKDARVELQKIQRVRLILNQETNTMIQFLSQYCQHNCQ